MTIERPSAVNGALIGLLQLLRIGSHSALREPVSHTEIERYNAQSSIVKLGFLPSKIRVVFPGESQLRQSRATQPTVHAGCFSVSMIHRTLTWTSGSFTCAQMAMHATAHGGVQTPSESLR